MSGRVGLLSLCLLAVIGIKYAEGDGCVVPPAWRKHNSYLKRSYPPMTDITLKCPGKLRLVADLRSRQGIVMCLFGGKWNYGSSKICEPRPGSVQRNTSPPDDKKCHPLPSWRRFNTNLGAAYETMSEIQLRCPYPRKLVPQLATIGGTVMCLFGGKWSFTRSEICTAPAKTECETQRTWRTFDRRLRRKYKAGQKIQLRCPRYLRMHLNPALEKVRGIITCLKGGKWSINIQGSCVVGRRRSRPVMKKKPCYTQPIWRTFNRKIRRYYPYGSTIKLSCPKSMQLLPALEDKGGVVKCLADGKWSFAVGAICVVGRTRLRRTTPSCQTPLVWKKALPGLLPSYPTSKVVAFKCPPHFSIHPRVRRDSAGRGVIACHKGGKWDFKKSEKPCVKQRVRSSPTKPAAASTLGTERILAQAACSAQAMTKGFVFAIPKSCLKGHKGKTCDDLCGDTSYMKQDRIFRSTKFRFRFTCVDSLYVMYLPNTPATPFIKTLTYQSCRQTSCLINYCCCHASFRPIRH